MRRARPMRRWQCLLISLLVPLCASPCGLVWARMAEGSGAPTYARDIAPIIRRECSVCHRPGEAAPFSLLSYQDVRKRGRLIEAVTESRYMPPWFAGEGWGEFEGERRLSEEEIGLIATWVAAGMPEGEYAEPLMQEPGFKTVWMLGKPDLVLRMEEPFQIPAEGSDIYRGFAIRSGLTRDTWVRAIAIRPSAPTATHHALYFFDATGESRKRQREDPRPGFADMPISLFATKWEGAHASIQETSRTGSLGSWAVGRSAWALPEGMAYFLPAHSDFILQMHFRPTGKAETEQCEIGLYFSDGPPRTSFLRLQLPPLFGVLARIDIPAGDPSYTITDSMVLPVDSRVFAATAHAHCLGKEFKVWASLPDGSEERLLWIPRWDFSWQEQYQYKRPVFLPAGTRVHATITYDNSEKNPANPHHPPREVVWGRKTTDEMGSISLYISALQEEKFARLKKATARHLARAWAIWAVDEDNASEIVPERLRKRFDEDHDGRLSEPEKESLRAFLRE